MTDLPPAGPDRLLALLDCGDLLRGAWTDGHERLSVLAALSDEVREAEDAAACPASLMPAWLAQMMPELDDHVSEDGWEGRMRRLGESARSWPALDADAWDRVRLAVLLYCLGTAEAAVTVDEWGVTEAIHGVREALQGRGDLAAAADAARAAFDASWIAPEAAADAALVAKAAAEATALVAEAAARAATEAADVADAAAWAAAWDRVCDALLDAIDAEVARAA